MIFPPQAPDAATNASTKRTPSVRLQQFVPHRDRSEIELNLILEAFNILLRTSADAALDQVPSIYTFQEKCLYLGTIHEDSVNNLGRGYEQAAQAFRDGQSSDESYPVEIETASQSRWAPEPYTGSSSDWHLGRSFSNANENHRENGTSAWEDTGMDEMYEEPSLPSHFTKTFVGIIYFLPHLQYPSEVSLGLALLPDHCNRGIGPRAVLQALEMAFDQFAFHRVCAAIVDGPTREHANRMFVALGFAHEGIRRRAIMSVGPGQNENTWRDVHHLGLLDTDWAVCGGGQTILNILDSSANINDTGNNEETGKAKAKRTRWDEMFTRHQREREELIGFDDRDKVLKRTLSTETLRPPTTAADSSVEASSASEAESDVESVRSGYGTRSPSPAFSAATNPFASPADFSSSTRLLYDSTIDPLLSDSGSARDRSGAMVAAWRASSSTASDAYTHSDVESDSEMHALLPRTRRRSMRRTNSRSGSLVDPFVFEMGATHSMQFASPPPQTDVESYISESEVDRYASCEEEEEDDENEGNGATPNDHGSSTVVSRLPSGLETLSPSKVPDPLEGLLASPHVTKRRRTCDFVAAATSFPVAEHEYPNTAIPTSATASGDSQLQATSVIGSSSILQLTQGFTVPVPPPIVPSLSYRLSEREILGADAMDTDADLEGTWDLLSTSSESESSVSSSSSLSLQSASDSE